MLESGITCGVECFMHKDFRRECFFIYSELFLTTLPGPYVGMGGSLTVTVA